MVEITVWFMLREEYFVICDFCIDFYEGYWQNKIA